MRIFKINNFMSFTGVRQDRNTVTQLQNDNPYDLNLPNQRRISTAIDDLGNVKGEDNINFLLDVSENLRYGTNIDLGKQSYNDWRAKLNKAAIKSYKLSDKSVQERLAARLDKVINEKREITPEEKEILTQRQDLLNSVDVDELKAVKNSNTRNLKRNLDYFIVSSEVPTSQKLYILKRLNYLMSDEYNINPQLKDKKTQVLAEILNDIVVNTPESKIPNIKQINQRQHGMCVAISVCRKALAYEDKANYVDMVLSELDDSDYMQVYDRSQLGKHKKIPLPKADIDYNYALEKGYRIVDASVMNWMNAADTTGAFNDVIGAYSTFDKDDFGTFADTHIFKDINENSAKYQDYYRACKKAKDALASVKRSNVVDKYNALTRNSNHERKITIVQNDRNLMQGILTEIAPTLPKEDVRKITYELLSLRTNYSDEINKKDSLIREFCFVPNEEDEVKIDKIKGYLNEVLPDNKNIKVLEEKSPELLELTEEIYGNSKSNSKTPAAKYYGNESLYRAAAAYRTMKVFSLDIEENLGHEMVKYNIPDNETYLMQNLRKLSKDIRSGKMNPELKEKLTQSFASEIKDRKASGNAGAKTDEILAQVLDEYADTVKIMMTTMADDFYNSLLAGDRKNYLSTQLSAVKSEIEQTKDKDEIKTTAEILKVKPERNAIVKQLDKYISRLNNPNCSDEEYFEIMNKCGHKSNLLDIKGVFDNAAELIRDGSNPNYIAGFNLMNGADQNADLSVTQNIYTILAKSFNNMSVIIKTLQDAVQITGDDGTILNSADPKYAVLKKMENLGEIPTEKELIDFRTKFDAFAKNRYAADDTKVLFKDMPKYLTTFTPFEKEALKKYQSHINSWYSNSSRDLNQIYRYMKEPLEELNREIGVQKGEYWARENESGLMDNQAVKIFEHMTDRPYYTETNARRGVEKIKNSPYSGSSMTSVSDTAPAMHAQYVADIRPMPLRNESTEVVKDVIFHDNTWGAAEHDNVWKDKYGLTRTDYSSEYGGELGYITNERYQNGKLAENLVDKKGKSVPKSIPSKMYKKLTPGCDEEYSFQLLSDFILQGTSPLAMSTAKSIKQNILLPSYNYVDELTDYAKNMTTSEMNEAFKRIETAGQSSRAMYADFLKKIKGSDDMLDKGIDSEEKYNKLNPDDKLRLMCEKVAIIKSYDDIPDINTYHIEVKSQKDIKKLQDKLRKLARDNFDYALGKNPDVLKYGAESSRKDIYKILKQVSVDNSLNLSYDKMVKIVNAMKTVPKENFDGSISDSIELMTAQFKKALQDNASSKLSSAQIEETSNQVREILNNNFEISAKDVKIYFNSGRLKHFADWIDREFAPQTDEEFAKILSNLRNMTTEEFNKKYGSSVTDVDMGITPYSGYDIVKLIRNENDSVKNTFINTIFSEAYYKDIEESKIRPYYDLRKFSRNLSSGTYVGGKRSFDDIYSDFYSSLSLLTIKKTYNKYKDDAFKKYFAFPAYPLAEISTPEMLEESLNTFYQKLNEYMEYYYAYKNQQASLNKITALKQYVDKLNPSETLTTAQYNKIYRALENVLAQNENDETFKPQIEQARNIFESGTKSVKEYREVINSLYDTFKIYEKTVDNKTMDEAAKTTLQNIDIYKKTYVMNLFEPKYQGKAFELLNKWISARSKARAVQESYKSFGTEGESEMSQAVRDKLAENVQEADKYYNQFKDLFYKHRLLENPDALLKEYLLLNTKDAKAKGIMASGNDKERAKKELEDMRGVYKDNLKSLLYKADMMELQYILMECAEHGNLNAVRDAFKNSTIELKNGTVVPMDSDEGLQIMVNPLLGEKNLDTAALFINQLGLSERICEILMEDDSLKDAYKNFDRTQRILKSADSQAKFARDEFRKLGNFDNNPDYEQIIENYRQTLLKKINRTSYRGSKDIFNSAIDDALSGIKAHPDSSKTVELGTNIDIAISALAEVMKANIMALNQPAAAIQLKYDLIRKLIFPDGSPMIDKAQEFIDNIGKLVEYENSKVQSYPNIGITQA